MRQPPYPASRSMQLLAPRCTNSRSVHMLVIAHTCMQLPPTACVRLRMHAHRCSASFALRVKGCGPCTRSHHGDGLSLQCLSHLLHQPQLPLDVRKRMHACEASHAAACQAARHARTHRDHVRHALWADCVTATCTIADLAPATKPMAMPHGVSGCGALGGGGGHVLPAR